MSDASGRPQLASQWTIAITTTAATASSPGLSFLPGAWCLLAFVPLLAYAPFAVQSFRAWR